MYIDAVKIWEVLACEVEEGLGWVRAASDALCECSAYGFDGLHVPVPEG